MRSVLEEEPANEGIGLRSRGDIMGHTHSLILFFLFSFFVSLPIPLLTPTIAYIHIPQDARISYSCLPLFTFSHLYSLVWRPPSLIELDSMLTGMTVLSDESTPMTPSLISLQMDRHPVYVHF